jgi:F-type H+-transporting ATPase subunit epsilon
LGEVVYYAINQGILVKQGDVVSVACLQAIRGTTLETLGDTVDASFRSQDENERRMNEVLTKLEVDTLRLFMDLD